MKNKAVFLDRDDTINKDFGYVYQKEKLEFLPGAIEGLKKFQENGYKLIIITNQSGIGRGYFTEKQYLDFNNYFLSKLLENGVSIDKVYYCKHAPEDNCECRKPKLSLFEQAIIDFDIDLDSSCAIGDKERDISISKETNVKGFILGQNDFNSIDDVANYILK